MSTPTPNAIDDDEIEALARLAAHLVTKDDLSEDERRALDRVGELGDADRMLVLFGSKMLSGKPYMISSDDPVKVRRSIALAVRLGVTVRSHESEDSQTVVVFDPPPRQ